MNKTEWENYLQERKEPPPPPPPPKPTELLESRILDEWYDSYEADVDHNPNPYPTYSGYKKKYNPYDDKKFVRKETPEERYLKSVLSDQHQKQAKMEALRSTLESFAHSPIPAHIGDLYSQGIEAGKRRMAEKILREVFGVSLESLESDDMNPCGLY